jgi:hypothetical protein
MKSVRVALFAVSFVALGALGAVAVASDDAITIVDNGATITHECHDGTDVDVMGNENHVTLTGACGKVSVSGNENSVAVEAAAAIVALGNENTVVWEKGAGGKAPKITNLGTKNKISKKK